MRRTVFLLAAFAAAPAFAHPAPDAMGFVGGLLHPVSGLDHLLAALVVGLWAAHLGARARWVVPATFVTAMSLTAVTAATTSVVVPHFEAGITASLICIGALVAIAWRVTLVPAALVVMAFAAFHGAAHGTEGAFSGGYLAGLLSATASLHGVGLFMGTHRMRTTARAFGVLTAAVGVLLAFI